MEEVSEHSQDSLVVDVESLEYVRERSEYVELEMISDGLKFVCLEANIAGSMLPVADRLCECSTSTLPVTLSNW